MFFHQRFIPGLAIASYMVGDEQSKSVAVIDPTRDVDEYLRIAREEGLRITHILETHVHADYVSGAVELKARLDGTPKIVASGMGGAEWTPRYADVVAQNGDEVSLGKIRLKAMHTPGHTPEHVTWALFDDTRDATTPWLLFTGDFLFVGDVGRPDLLGAEQRKELAHRLYESVFDKLSPLPDYTEIFPAHGAGSLCGKAIGSRRSSTIGYERRFNASLKPNDEASWTASLLKDMPPAPPYFRRMKAINANGPAILGREMPGLKRLPARDVNARLADVVILDVRQKEAFASAHVPGSLNIPLAANMPSWAGWFLPYDKHIVLVVDDESDARDAITHLIRVGFDLIDGYLEGGIEAWQSAGFPIAKLDTISVHELAERIQRDSKPFLLDVRTQSEWNGGHIDGATFIHVGLLPDHLSEVPKDRDVAILCGSGYRASIAGSVLKRHGYDRVSNVLGGMTAWKAAKLPVAT